MFQCNRQQQFLLLQQHFADFLSTVNFPNATPMLECTFNWVDAHMCLIIWVQVYLGHDTLIVSRCLVRQEYATPQSVLARRT